MYKLIRESLDFERNREPHHSMRIGRMAQIEQWLDQMGVENYIINDDFSIDVKTDVVYLQEKDLTEFPPFIKFRRVEGSFYCNGNKLISLEGSPSNVGVDFYCSENRLVSLEGGPSYVGRNFSCGNNELNSLKGAPSYVGRRFYCRNNSVKFSIEDVKKICQVNGEIYE